jgi:DNA-binding MarR family transcriptional regulator
MGVEAMTLPLTPKQERVWRYIRSCERSPTYREMERDLGINIGRLNDVIVSLKERGFVSFLPRRHRSIVALDPKADLSAFPTEVLAAEIARRLGA